MNDSKIISKYKDEYRDFINNEIIPIANKTLLDGKQIELSAYNDAGSVIGINAILISLKQSDKKTIEYTPDERCYKAFGDLVDDSMHRVKVGNQKLFL